MMYKSNKQGQCPYCNSNKLEYGVIERQEDGLAYYPWTCKNCGHSGEEWYELKFIGHNDEDGQEIELEVE